MKEKGSFKFLGTGGSMGVPLIGCDCDVCKSTDPHNYRLRPSGLLQVGGKSILFDCGPDFRLQMLQNQIKTIDGLVFTHAHYDHTGGFDEIRIFNARSGQPLPCLLSQATLDELTMRFPYVFAKTNSPVMTTKVKITLLEELRGTIEFLGIPFRYMTYEQGGMAVNGFRIGDLAYISDIRHYPETIFDDLAGIETLIVSCLRYEYSPLHFNVEEAVAFTKCVGAKKAWFTHIAHELDHEKTNAFLPSNYQLAYDGLEINFEIT
jgi:phosphoribosyl 1,2-cyclic phosphate phosphodiesterase